MPQTEIKRPARLELNNTGTWKCIAHLDVSDDQACNEVLDGASKLAPFSGGKWRLVTDDKVCPVMLMQLKNPTVGWEEAE